MTPFKKHLALILFIGALNLNAQTEGVSIKTSVGPPHPSAMLDIESSSKGLLIPRVNLVNLTSASPIISPLNSLLVFNNGTSLPKGYYYWEQTTPTAGTWIKLGTGTGSGASLWAPIGSTANIYYAAGKVRVGSAALPAPAFALEVKTASGDEIFKFEGASGSLLSTSGGGYYGNNIVQKSFIPGIGTRYGQYYSDGKEGIAIMSIGTNNGWTPDNYSWITAGDNNRMYITSNTSVTIHAGKSGNQWIGSYYFTPTGFIQSSDSTLKVNVTNLPSVINKIKQCRPVTYNWKTSPNSTKMNGFIAQELERIFPELVDTRVSLQDTLQKPIKSINYIGLTSILVKAIKEQQQQIENQNAEHQIQINALTQRILALENK